MVEESSNGSHHLSLNGASRLLALHRVATLVGVADVGQTERTTTVLVALELGDGRAGVLLVGELNDTSAARASVGLVGNLGTINLGDRLE